MTALGPYDQMMQQHQNEQVLAQILNMYAAQQNEQRAASQRAEVGAGQMAAVERGNQQQIAREMGYSSLPEMVVGQQNKALTQQEEQRKQQMEMEYAKMLSGVFAQRQPPLMGNAPDPFNQVLPGLMAGAGLESAPQTETPEQIAIREYQQMQKQGQTAMPGPANSGPSEAFDPFWLGRIMEPQLESDPNRNLPPGVVSYQGLNTPLPGMNPDAFYGASSENVPPFIRELMKLMRGY